MTHCFFHLCHFVVKEVAFCLSHRLPYATTPPCSMATVPIMVFVYMQMYGGSIATMEKKRYLQPLKEVRLLCQSGARSYDIRCVSWRKNLVSTLISLQQLLPLHLTPFCSFASFLVCSAMHRFSKLLNRQAMFYNSLKLRFSLIENAGVEVRLIDWMLPTPVLLQSFQLQSGSSVSSIR